jgi:DNA-binding transcriptional LysR family regulator
MLDWDDVRVFLAVARAGSQIAAAHSLHTSQPSVDRRLAALKTRLGSKLVVSSFYYRLLPQSADHSRSRRRAVRKH